MRTTMNNREELFETILQLCDSHYSDISRRLVEKILEIEAESLDDRSEVHKKIERLVESYLEER